MTGTYEWHPMPHLLDVRCPSCNARAVFEFAVIVRIRLREDVAFFQESRLFDYSVFQDSCGHNWHGAIYHAGLHGGSVEAIHTLPEGYSPGDWSPSRYYSHLVDRLAIGSVVCRNCGLQRRHPLRWPEDAYYSIRYRDRQLWAFNRESATDLRDYIRNSHRDVDNYHWRNFLLHVPTVFKKRGAREYVVRHLDRLLYA